MVKKLCLDFYRACRHRGSPATRLQRNTRLEVVAGPFCGMHYLDQALGSVLPAKLLGTYERELHPWLERLFYRDYQHLFDAGCAEGYYAVGFALRMPHLQVQAFDSDPRSQGLVSKLARLNGVESRIHCRGEFSQGSLLDSDRGLLICDIEGAEKELLCPLTMPALKNMDVLVEVHDANDGSIESFLRERFRESHRIEKVCAQTRRLEDLEYQARAFLPLWSPARLLHEKRRLGLSWLLLTRINPQQD